MIDFPNMPEMKSMMKTWRVGASEFCADIERGARLLSWRVLLAGGKFRDVILPPDKADMDNNPRQAFGGNPILFPFASSHFADGKAGFWKDLKGVVRPMPIHGYAISSRFEPIEISDGGFSARMVFSDEAKNSYPFECEFRVSYAFSEFSMICDQTLVNLSSSDIPWAAGNHFYFNLPWIAGTTRADYKLNIDAKKQYAYTPDGNLIERDFIDNPQFSDDIVNRIFKRLKTNRISFGPKNGEENISIRIGSSPKPAPQTTVVTWTKSVDAPYFCVEPWMGPPNASSDKKNMSVVRAGEASTFSVEVGIF